MRISKCVWMTLALACAGTAAEVRTLTLKEAVELALKQAPDVLLSRLEQQQAAEKVNIARDPFLPKVFAGSGLAYSSGFPMSVEGSAPAIVQARAVASVFDKPKKLQLQQAREEVRGAGLAAEGKREQAVRKTVDLYLAAERSRRMAEMARKQVEAAGKLAAIVQSRVQEGRELAIEARRADLEIAKAQQRVEAWEAEQDYAEASLAMVLGLEAGQRARAALEERTAPRMPVSAEEAAERALRDNRELRTLASAMAAKNLEMRSFQAARYPKLDLVAQYGLFARFNNFEDFFQKFQRHNGQLGISFQIPLWTGPATAAGAAAAKTEVSRLQLQTLSTRSRIRLEAEQGFHEVKKAETARQVARLELDLARESLTIVLAQFEEGRAGLQQVEAARMEENEKWLRYYESQHGLERARFQMLERTGELMAAFR
jgi:outer membrane protein